MGKIFDIKDIFHNKNSNISLILTIILILSVQKAKFVR